MHWKDIGNGEEIKMIEKFSSVQEIKETARYYEELLGLQDWMITYKHTDDLCDPENAGENEVQFVNKFAVIRIRKTLPDGMIFNQPQELVLIHELLHCKFLSIDNGTYDGLMLDEYQHQLLNDMARAIFNARYSLTNKYYLTT